MHAYDSRILPIMELIADFEKPEGSNAFGISPLAKSQKKMSMKDMGTKIQRTFSSPMGMVRKKSQPSIPAMSPDMGDRGSVEGDGEDSPKFVENMFDFPVSVSSNSTIKDAELALELQQQEDEAAEEEAFEEY